MREEWVRWLPFQGVAKNYDIVSISDTLEDFRITFVESNNPQNFLNVIFKAVLVYRNTIETYRLNTIGNLLNTYGNDFLNWTFFRVSNSRYLDWLIEKSDHIIDKRSFTHFVFGTDDVMIDVLCGTEPVFEQYTKE